MKTRIHDVVGIGFGPANIALAIALEELAPHLSVQFLEQRNSALWQPGMMLEGSDIQNHPLRDLVTPRNPRSRYSFVNFLHEQGRLFEHLNLPLHYPLRLEYAQYVSWAAKCFDRQVAYGCEVTDLVRQEGPDPGDSCFKVICADGTHHLARAVVLAPGRTPYVPTPFDECDDSRIVHFTDYLPALDRLKDRGGGRIAVVGGSQSAVEILLHAVDKPFVRQTVGITRNFGFRQKDTSPFSDEVYFPDFVDLFYAASPAQKERLRRELVFTNYSSSDIDVLNQLYVHLYTDRLQGRESLSILTCQDIQGCDIGAEGIILQMRHYVNRHEHHEVVDLVVLATGFLDLGVGERREPWPQLLRSISSLFKSDVLPLELKQDYQVRFRDPDQERTPLYLNGLCESSHGMGDAGSFSLLSLRTRAIVESLCAQIKTPLYETRTNVA